ncbi:MAG TPA: hypothetical protein DCY17_00830 [Clostridiales bacterium]|nr:hypothetical protein [Clostridiales bacterium]
MRKPPISFQSTDAETSDMRSARNCAELGADPATTERKRKITGKTTKQSGECENNGRLDTFGETLEPSVLFFVL